MFPHSLSDAITIPGRRNSRFVLNCFPHFFRAFCEYCLRCNWWSTKRLRMLMDIWTRSSSSSCIVDFYYSSRLLVYSRTRLRLCIVGAQMMMGTLDNRFGAIRWDLRSRAVSRLRRLPRSGCGYRTRVRHVLCGWCLKTIIYTKTIHNIVKNDRW